MSSFISVADTWKREKDSEQNRISPCLIVPHHVQLHKSNIKKLFDHKVIHSGGLQHGNSLCIFVIASLHSKVRIYVCFCSLSLYLSFVVEHCYSSTSVRIVLIKDFTCSYRHACPASLVCTCSLVSTSCQRNVSRGKKCLHVP